MNKRYKYIVIGGGFSSFVAKLFLNQKAQIYTAKFARPPMRNYVIQNFFNIKKFFFSGSPSIGLLRTNLKNTHLHSILYPGGNTNIWGGFINTKNLPKSLLNFFYSEKIILNTISSKSSGSESNNRHIYQLTEFSGHILNVALRLKGYTDAFIDSFQIKNNKIQVVFYDNSGQRKIITTNNLILCVGLIDLVDLLYRSGFIRNGDVLELSEFKYVVRLKYCFIFSKFNNTSSLILRYDLIRALCHYLGYQKRFCLSYFFKYIPLTVEQVFYKKKNKIKLHIENGSISEFHKYHKNNFGNSIHYSGLKINNLDINSFLFSIHHGLHGLGMPFVKQRSPGPISNDILLDAYKKFSKL